MERRTYRNLSLISLILFFTLVLNIFKYKIVDNLDLKFNSFLGKYLNPFGMVVMENITKIGDFWFFFILTLIVFVLLIYKKRYKDSLFLVFVLGIGFLINESLKLIFQRARPINGLIEADGYSFPSGHAFMSTLLFLSLIYFFSKDIKKNKLKVGFIIVNLLIIFTIAFSRVYLGVHWFSDILSGLFFGVFWLSLFILTRKGNQKKKIRH